MFDEFLDELRRRQDEAAGRSPRRDPDEGSPGDADDESAAGDEPRDARGSRSRGAGDARDDDAGPTPIGARRRSEPGGRDRPPPRRPRGDRPVGGPDDGSRGGLRRRIFLGLGIAIIVAIALMLVVGLELWTDAIWYQSVGYGDVFWRRLTVQVGLFALGLIAALALLLGNLWLAGRLLPPSDGPAGGSTLRSFIDRLNEAAAQAEGGPGRRFDPYGRGGRSQVDVTPYDMPDPTPIGRIVIAGFAIFIALTVAGAIASNWETLLLWLNRVPFAPDGAPAVPDPVFGRDVSFFLFDLAFLRFVQATVIGLIVASLAVAGGRYLLGALAGSSVFSTPVRVHLGVLAGLFLMAIAFGYQLDKFELVYSNRGVATGVSYTDANAQFLAYDVLTALSAIAAAFLVGGAFSRVMWPLGLTAAVWFIASIGIGRIYPEVVQRITVTPNEPTLESRFISNNISMTRLGFDLGDWDVRDYRGEAPLTQAAIDEHEATFLNARLWDYRPLGQTLDQLQTVRQYYTFTDVDTDRYRIGDETRQVMLSVRELALEQNPDATGWVNQRLVFTHGIGLTMVPVNEVGSQGQPRLVIQNLPPVSSAGAPEITEPRVYFGERPSDYIVVGTQTQEFDYPRGQTDVKNTWAGTTGIRLDTTLSRLLFALRFGDFNLLISDQVTRDSQILLHRSLGDRLPLIAPFLRYDKDPYVVIDEAGRLSYIQDAYTVTDRFPNAQHFAPGDLGQDTGLRGGAFNYIRNSVKIVVDAYDGTMDFYVNDPDDPLIRAWQGVFPTLFQPMSAFPDDLRSHIRYPEELFGAQTRVYGRYHVQNPLTFYQQDDLWTIPQGQSTEQSLATEAYYVIMSLPDEDEAEFLLLQPMIPRDRPNMIAWVAARNDGEAYGETRVYRFPTETSVFGPNQIEAQISADPEISAQVTLWSQSGSTVIRGNLIVVPVGESLVYLQPFYLRSTTAQFPVFQKIVVASPTTVVWGDTLKEALDQLLEDQDGGPGPTPTPAPTDPGASPTPAPTPAGTPAPGATPPAGDVAALIEYANLHFELAQAALREGDFATYGEEIALVEQALSQLEELAGEGAGSSPAPSAAP